MVGWTLGAGCDEEEGKKNCQKEGGVRG